MSFRRLILFFTVLVSGHLSAQTELYNGRIIDSHSFAPLPNVKVVSLSFGDTAFSNEIGVFQMQRSVGAGDTLVLSVPYYQSDTVFVKAGAYATPNIGLNSSRQGLLKIINQDFSSGEPLLYSGKSVQLADKELFSAYANLSAAPVIEVVPEISPHSLGTGSIWRNEVRGNQEYSFNAASTGQYYWNGMNITSPDGATTTEWFAPSDFNQVEFQLSPSSWLTGGENTAVMSVRSIHPLLNQSYFSSAYTGGAHGFRKANQTFSYGHDKFSTRFSLINESDDEYRVNGASSKDQFIGQLNFLASPQRMFSLFINVFSSLQEFPGGISQQQQADNPILANPEAVRSDAREEQHGLGVGFQQEFHFAPHWLNSTGLWLHSQTDLRFSPGLPGVEGIWDGGSEGFSFRTRFQYTREEWEFNAGFQAARDRNITDAWLNQQGFRGSILYSADFNAFSGSAFGNVKYKIGKLQLCAGASFTPLHYNYLDKDTLPKDQGGFYDASSLAAGTSASFQLNPNQSLFLTAGSGQKNPSIYDLLEYNGDWNSGLFPENQQTIDLGWRWKSGNKWQCIFNGFASQTQNYFLPQPGYSGNWHFVNLGTAKTTGISLSAQFRPHLSPKNGLVIFGSGSWQSNQLSQKDGNPFQSQSIVIPGIASYQAYLGFTYCWQNQLKANAIWQFTGPETVGLVNAQQAKSYNTLNVMLNYKLPLGKQWELDLHAGCKNITGSHFTTWYSMLATNGDLYNPMPIRDWFAGLRLVFKFPPRHFHGSFE